MSDALQVLKKMGQAQDSAIVFLHGFGADANDLAPLAQALNWSPLESWYFPNAPLEVPIGPGFWGRAWFPVSASDVESGVDFSRAQPPGMEKAVQTVLKYIDSLPHQRIVIGGFSQGAMVATQAVLSRPEKFSGLVVLSGSLVDEPRWKKQAAAVKPSFEFFQSHGSRDTVLPIDGAVRLNRLLTESGWEGQWHEFAGAHEIPTSVVRELKSYLRHQLSAQKAK